MTQAKNSTVFGVGMLGATGFIGTPYRDEIREAPNARMVALCARRKDLLEAAGRKDRAKLVTDDWKQVVEHPDVNLVVIATPDALHHEAVMACAAAGKHVLCEKPVAVNASQAREMWHALRDAKLAHFVPFWTRYADVVVKARELVDAGAVGDIRTVIYRWFNPRPAGMPLTWRDDAGLSAAGSIADVGSHAYDTVRWILGREATRVLAHADTITPSKADLGAVNLAEALEWGQSHGVGDAKSRRGGTVDYANVAWEFPGGVVGALTLSHATYLRKGLAPELEFHGTKASLAVDRVSGRLTLAKPDQSLEVVATIPDNGFGNRFAKYVFPGLEQFLLDGTANYPDLEDGYRVQVFTDAVALSARQGGWADVRP